MENEILLNVVEVTEFGNRRGGKVKLRRPQTYHTNKYHCNALFYRIPEVVPNLKLSEQVLIRGCFGSDIAK